MVGVYGGKKGKAKTRGELGDLIGFSLVNLTSPPSSLSTVLLEVCNFNSLILKPDVGMYILIQFPVSSFCCFFDEKLHFGFFFLQ